MYGLIGRFVAVDGRRDELAAILLDGTGSMPGCLSYVVATDPADGNALWVTEVWRDEASHRASLALPSVRSAIARGRPLIAGFDSRSETRPLGGHGLGLSASGGVPSGRPQAGEFADYAADDIARVAGDDAVAALAAQGRDVFDMFAVLTDADVAGRRYAPGKWTVKEVLGHLIDDERIFCYRLLRVARGDGTPLPGFDEKLFAVNSEAEHRPLRDLVAEYVAVREATLALLRALSPAAWTRRGVVNDYEASARGLAFHIAGHELRHVAALSSLYRIDSLTTRAATAG